MAIQFEDFKKQIKWYKSQDAWCGQFDIDSTPTRRGMSFSMRATPEMAARVAKPAIAQDLYERVSLYCAENGIELNVPAKKKSLAKTNK